ncbi:hypothetical protein BpsM61_00068 [Bacillus phage vB_BpsM-61]|nr:hypothetical protein BpsM61_00068 [Bacillus phage vB_BpsM-61]
MGVNIKTKNKNWKKVTMYLIPVIALVVANLLRIDDPTQIESSLTILFTAILGVFSALGIIDNPDNDDKEKDV